MRKLKRALAIVTAVCVIAGNVMMDPVPLYAAENSDVQIEQETEYQEPAESNAEDTSQGSIRQNTEEGQEPAGQSTEDAQEPAEQSTEDAQEPVKQSIEDQEPIEQNTEEQESIEQNAEDQELTEQNAENDQELTEQNTENDQESAGQENIQQNDGTSEAEGNSVQEEIQEEEQTDTPQNDGVEVQSEETADSESAEEEAVSEENPDADPTAENSWRYSNGNRIEQPSTYSKASYPYAWEKVNGKFMNSNGEVIPGATKKGIDVSVHNGKIDWQKVKNDGIDFAIIRCGYGQNMTSQDDVYWEYNVSECERLGIPYGVYLYSYANTLAKAKSEAQHANSHFLRPAGPHFPASQGHIKRSALEIGRARGAPPC